MKPIPGWEGLYSIEEDGRVWSHRNNIYLKWNKCARNKYAYVELCNGGKKKEYIRIHRTVALVYVPNPEGKPETNHKDGNKLNNHFSNLEWVTSSENHYHAYRVLKVPRGTGETHSQAKFTKEQVEEIRQFREKTGMSYEKIGKKYGVYVSTIFNICKHNTWK